MQTAARALLPVLLLFAACLDDCRGGDVGCALWITSGLTDVCCQRCHQGNILVNKCGLDPKKLCAPCGVGTYMEEAANANVVCRSCTKCRAPQVETRPCSSSSDAVCGCGEGYRCADGPCSHCAKECAQGEEPTGKLTCRACPDGMFNDQIHHHCTPWRTRCPLPGQQIVAQGTSVHDSICGNLTKEIPILRTTQWLGDDGKVTFIMVIVCLSLFAICAITLVSIVTHHILRKKQKKTTRDRPAAEEPAREHPKWEEQKANCSLCHPQQEQGGSLSSVASQGSEDKLLPV